MILPEQLIEGGKLFKPHGYKGEINATVFFSLTPSELKRIPFIFDIDGLYVPFFCTEVRTKGENLLLKFKGLNSDFDVKLLVNKVIYFKTDQIESLVDPEELEKEEDITGYDVIDSTTGKILGKVSDVEVGVEYDYIVFERKDNGKEVRIPMVDEFITDVSSDNGEGFILVDIPDGLLDLD